MCKLDDALDKARKCIDNISFKNIVTLEGPGDYSMGEGKARLKVIQDRQQVEIIHGKLEPGTVTEVHTHDEKEIYVCYSGSIVINDENALMLGDIYYVTAGTPHWVSSEEGAEILVIRVPSSGVKDYGRK